MSTDWIHEDNAGSEPNIFYIKKCIPVGTELYVKKTDLLNKKVFTDPSSPAKVVKCTINGGVISKLKGFIKLGRFDGITGDWSVTVIYPQDMPPLDNGNPDPIRGKSFDIDPMKDLISLSPIMDDQDGGKKRKKRKTKSKKRKTRRKKRKTKRKKRKTKR